MKASDILGHLVSAHASTLILTPSLHEQFMLISETISILSAGFTSMEKNLMGLLKPFTELKKKKEEEKKSQLRQRWDRMVQETQDGVGKYAIEVFRF